MRFDYLRIEYGTFENIPSFFSANSPRHFPNGGARDCVAALQQNLQSVVGDRTVEALENDRFAREQNHRIAQRDWRNPLAVDFAHLIESLEEFASR